MTNKIKDEANEIIARLEQTWPDGCAECAKQAQRVLLLEKAYRYQRAARNLESFSFYLLAEYERDSSREFQKRADLYGNKAAALYKQAEEV